MNNEYLCFMGGRFVTVSCSMAVINPYPSYFLDIHLKNKLLIRDN